jgi:5-methylcytosine-specific restriction protein A
MPVAAPRRCPTCRGLFTADRCPTCVKARDERRGTAAQRGYCSARWRRLRAAKLSQAPLCSVCSEPATEVDHLERHDGPNDPRFWSCDNLDSKCKRCHARKTALFDSVFARRDRNITATTPSPNRLAGHFSRGHNSEGPVIG